METKFRESENLKIQANKIFDGLIESAYFELYNEDVDSLRNKMLTNQISKINVSEYLDYSLATIVLKFKNGALVELSCSEWATLKKLNSIELS